MSALITTTYPATFHEVGYLRTGREHRPWYVVQRGEEIGLTPEIEQGDKVISTYEDDEQ